MDENLKEESLENLNEVEPKIYEIGYLLTPILPQDSLAEQVVQAIKSPIDKCGGAITSEMDPSMIRLAYTMKKTVANKKERYNEAYFGALRFKLLPEKALILKEILDKNDKIVRFMIVSIAKGGEVIVVPKRAYQKRETKPLEKMFEIERREKEGGEVTEEVKEMTSEDLDKEIDNLLEEKNA